jgi:SAM-dependent methyltransferase
LRKSRVEEPSLGRYQHNRRSVLSILQRTRQVAHERGWGYVLRFFFDLAWLRVSKPFGYLACRLRKEKQFMLAGRQYDYYYHWYNQTWRNERAVEVPFILSMIQSCDPEDTLEIGNVLSHFSSVSHTVVDRFEKASGVVNVDVIDYHPQKKYNLIVSISTLEHVGWDERPRQQGKAIQAISHLQQLLKPGGKLVFTVPVGYNCWLDQAIRAGEVQYSMCYCLQRISRDNRWREVDCDMIAGVSYGHPFHAANGLFICEYQRPDRECSAGDA